MTTGGEKRRGVKNGASKLTEDAVRDIRVRYVAGTGRGHAVPGNAGELAKQYGVNRRTILSIAQGMTWGWVE